MGVASGCFVRVFVGSFLFCRVCARRGCQPHLRTALKMLEQSRAFASICVFVGGDAPTKKRPGETGWGKGQRGVGWSVGSNLSTAATCKPRCEENDKRSVLPAFYLFSPSMFTWWEICRNVNVTILYRLLLNTPISHIIILRIIFRSADTSIYMLRDLNYRFLSMIYPYVNAKRLLPSNLL